jgi:serine protease
MRESTDAFLGSIKDELMRVPTLGIGPCLLAISLLASQAWALSPSPRHKKRFIARYHELSTSQQNQRRRAPTRRIVQADEVQDFRNNADIAYVEEDIILTHNSLSPSDPLYSQQWPFFDATGGVNAEDAWDITIGSNSIVVAVIDTGFLSHPDLNANVVSGADLISDTSVANDGNGRDNNGADPGDWVEFGDFCYQGSFVKSSWHGSHVAGTIAAAANNGQGVVGLAPGVKVQSVRALGKCGGFLSDIADAVRWASGGTVSGLSNNPTPAKVINMSLGGLGSCGSYMQEAIDFARSQGTVVVVAAGNDGVSLDFTSYTPANCDGVVVVGAANRFASRTSYSNYGGSVDLLAPGGDFTGGILSLSNTGTRSPSVNEYASKTGTSMASPHVAAVAALILSNNPALYPHQVEQLLKDGARSIACSSGCGAGLLDASESVALSTGVSPDPVEPGNGQLNPGSNRPTQWVEISEEKGGCGSVDLTAGRGGGGGSGLFVGLFLALILPLASRSNKIGKQASL